jgi:hypothetical protein
MSILTLAKLFGLVAVYGLVCLLLWLLFFDGIAARIVYDAKPQIIRYQTGRGTAFVYFTGTQSSGKDHSAPMRKVWGQYYDDIVVQYNPELFDGPTIVSAAHKQLRDWGYRKVVLDGASLGFMLVTDLIDYDRTHGNHFEFAVMSQDGFTRTDDLVQGAQAKAVARIWHAGPVANSLLTRLFWKLGFNPPPRNKLGSDVDDNLLQAHYHASKTQPLSGWTGQVRYMVGHRPYRHDEYAGIPIIIMRSHPEGRADDDGVVKSSAAYEIQKVFGGGTIIEVNGSSHIGFVEFTGVWRNKFQLGFAELARR